MASKKRKVVVLVLKIVVAAAMLSWVLSKASWNDFVVTKDNKTYTVLPDGYDKEAKTFKVSSGMLWWKSETTLREDQIQPVPKSQELIWPGLKTSIRDINVVYLILALMGFLASVFIIAVRWWFLLRIQEIRVRVWECIRLTFLGNFFNFIIPSTVGGDLFKAYYVSKHTPRKAAVLVTIFVDRVLGLTELTVLAGVMILIVLLAGIVDFAQIRQPAYMVLIVTGIVILAMIFLLSSRFRKILHLQKIYQRLPIAHHIAAAGDAADLYRKRVGSLLKAVAMTFGAHFTWVGAIAMIGMGLPMMGSVPWYKYFIYIPLIYIAGAIPITPGGIGLIEGLYIQFFTGVSQSTVLALALLARLIQMFWSLPGVIVAMTGPRLPKADAMEAELEAEAKAQTSAETLPQQSPK